MGQDMQGRGSHPGGGGGGPSGRVKALPTKEQSHAGRALHAPGGRSNPQRLQSPARGVRPQTPNDNLRSRRRGINTAPEEEMPKRARGLWNAVKYQLLDFHALPEYLRDNEFIHRHYRVQWPLRQSALSIFSVHNETLNIWTHLAGFWMFSWLTLYTMMKLPELKDQLPSVANLYNVSTSIMPSFYPYMPTFLSSCINPEASNRPELCVLLLQGCSVDYPIFNHDPSYATSTIQSVESITKEVTNIMAPETLTNKRSPRWPFFVFLSGAMFCLFASFMCHLFSCHSPRTSYFLLQIDYAGIVGLIASSFYPPVYYGFMCNKMLRNIYLVAITVIGLITVMVTMLPVFQTTRFRTFRAFMFFGMGVSGVVPCMHKLFLHTGEPAAIKTLTLEVFMGMFYALGALVYATRIPERWKPGKFDIAGNSHQIFHMLVVAGAYTHYQAGLIYLKWRDAKGCDLPN